MYFFFHLLLTIREISLVRIAEKVSHRYFIAASLCCQVRCVSWSNELKKLKCVGFVHIAMGDSDY